MFLLQPFKVICKYIKNNYNTTKPAKIMSDVPSLCNVLKWADVLCHCHAIISGFVSLSALISSSDTLQYSIPLIMRHEDRVAVLTKCDTSAGCSAELALFRHLPVSSPNRVCHIPDKSRMHSVGKEEFECWNVVLHMTGQLCGQCDCLHLPSPLSQTDLQVLQQVSLVPVHF